MNFAGDPVLRQILHQQKQNSRNEGREKNPSHPVDLGNVAGRYNGRINHLGQMRYGKRYQGCKKHRQNQHKNINRGELF